MRSGQGNEEIALCACYYINGRPLPLVLKTATQEQVVSDFVLIHSHCFAFKYYACLGPSKIPQDEGYMFRSSLL